jgi:protein O-mannosyl-transferase
MSQDADATAAGREPPASISIRDWRAWPVVAGLVLLVAVAFAPALDNGFVWDDTPNFLANTQYRGLGWEQFRWAWWTSLLYVYQPLGWLILEAEYAAFGLEPWGYHLLSVLLHAANAVALYALTLALLARRRLDVSPRDRFATYLLPGLAVALFAVHPLRVEVVAWVSCQTYLPCALFAMLSVLAYLRAHPEGPSARPKGGWLAGSVVLFAASLLCKAASVGVVGVFPILDVYLLRRLGRGAGAGGWFGPQARRVWLEKTPFVALALLFALVAVRVRAEGMPLVKPDRISSRIARTCHSAAFHAIKTIWPTGITAFYPSPPGPEDALSPAYLPSVIGVLAVSLGLFGLRRRVPGALAAWVAYLVVLAPVSGFVRGVLENPTADRYAYLSTAGWVVPVAFGLGAIRRRGGKPACVVAVVLVLGAIGGSTVLARRQCGIWHDAVALWTHARTHGAHDIVSVHINLGTALARRGQMEEAKEMFVEAARLDPDNAMAHNNLGWIYRRQGKFPEAIAEYTEALRLQPDFGLARRGLALARAGWTEEP